MNKIWLAGLVCCLLLFTWCTFFHKDEEPVTVAKVVRQERVKPTNLISYSWSFTSVWVWPDASWEIRADLDTLVLRWWVDDLMIHIYLPHWTYEDKFKSEDDYLPWTKLYIDAIVEKIQWKPGAQYYDVWDLKEVKVLGYPTSDELGDIFASYGRCEQDSDCSLLWWICPFDCYIAINNDLIETSSKLMAAFEKRLWGEICEYKCPIPRKAICRYNACMVSYKEEDETPIYNAEQWSRDILSCTDELRNGDCEWYNILACWTNNKQYINPCEACRSWVSSYLEWECN